MMKFFKQLFCGHYVSMEVCKIHYLPNSTELIYTKYCKDCGKKIGKKRIRTIEQGGHDETKEE